MMSDVEAIGWFTWWWAMPAFAGRWGSPTAVTDSAESLESFSRQGWVRSHPCRADSPAAFSESSTAIQDD
jgi:hypothetical protein